MVLELTFLYICIEYKSTSSNDIISGIFRKDVFIFNIALNENNQGHIVLDKIILF